LPCFNAAPAPLHCTQTTSSTCTCTCTCTSIGTLHWHLHQHHTLVVNLLFGSGAGQCINHTRSSPPKHIFTSTRAVSSSFKCSSTYIAPFSTVRLSYLPALPSSIEIKPRLQGESLHLMFSTSPFLL
jgi:hypothetical protein